MQAFAYSVDVSEATRGSSKQWRPTDAVEVTALQWHIFKLQYVVSSSCNSFSYWLKIQGLLFWFLLFQEGFISFIQEEKQTKTTNPVHLSQIANVHVESGLKQWTQGQIYSTAVIRKLSTVFLLLTHCRRSDLIGSRLDLYMDLETPKVWNFTSRVLVVGLKAEELERRGSSARRGWQDQDLEKEWQIEEFIPSWPNVDSAVAVPRVQPLLCCCAPGSPAHGSAQSSLWCSQSPFFRRWSSSGMWLLMARWCCGCCSCA